MIWLIGHPKINQVGKELSDEMNRALEKHGLENMRVFAVVSKSVGDLAGGRYYSKESVAAASLGMGTDVAYIESPQQIPIPPNGSSERVRVFRFIMMH